MSALVAMVAIYSSRLATRVGWQAAGGGPRRIRSSEASTILLTELTALTIKNISIYPADLNGVRFYV